ncbi:MAG: HAMP domain-containing histidine kinase [Arcobacteraceae bacterium]|nr:HAMP domain-containing histidine kinase [Arcobacteraceae bacterium]
MQSNEDLKQEIVRLNKKINLLTQAVQQGRTIKLKFNESSKLLKAKDKQLKELNNFLEQRVKDEVEANRSKDKMLNQQSRLAQMGEMISMIAHQWRQPLNAISLTSNNLMFKCMVNDMNKDLFQKELGLIDEYSQHLSKTIDDFRGFFKENKEKEVTTLEDIVNSTLDIIRTSIENKNIKISTNLNCKEQFETYPNEVKQVVLNIIKNAEDALLDNEICDKSDSTSCHKNPTITIESLCEDSNQILIIKDNAGGIPDNIKDKIFDPYFSTKLEKDGTGLGLYMSKTIIEEHCGGKLECQNDENGACFTIIFEKGTLNYEK